MGGDGKTRPSCMGHEVYYYMGSKVTEGLRCLVITSTVSLDKLREGRHKRGAQEREGEREIQRGRQTHREGDIAGREGVLQLVYTWLMRNKEGGRISLICLSFSFSPLPPSPPLSSLFVSPYLGRV